MVLQFLLRQSSNIGGEWLLVVRVLRLLLRCQYIATLDCLQIIGQFGCLRRPLDSIIIHNHCVLLFKLRHAWITPFRLLWLNVELHSFWVTLILILVRWWLILLDTNRASGVASLVLGSPHLLNSLIIALLRYSVEYLFLQVVQMLFPVECYFSCIKDLIGQCRQLRFWMVIVVGLPLGGLEWMCEVLAEFLFDCFKLLRFSIFFYLNLK